MPSGSDRGRGGSGDDEAPDWWSRMRGPDADQHRPAFERWLAADPRHREAYSKAQEAWQLSTEFENTEMGRNRSLERVRHPLALTAPRIAGIAAVAAAVLLVVFLRPGAQHPQPQPEIAVQSLQTDVGKIRTLDLPDGSKVTLDTDSQIQVHFSADARRIALVRGRARFEVREDPARTFIVEAGDRLVTAPQGHFDAALLPQGVCVSAWRGTLDVRELSAPYRTAAVFKVAPGRTAVFGSHSRLPGEAVVATGGSDLWVAGMLVYQATPLSLVLAETNRYSRRRILLGDASLGTLRVTGTFRPVPVDELAASLAAAFGLRVRKVPNGDLILERP